MAVVAVIAGSSPLTRGARGERHIRIRLEGIIPAHAGSTSADGLGAHVRPDHPRSRGEHMVVVRSCRSMMGSSPLTRGALLGDGGGGVHERIIPAHAGSTRYHGFRHLYARDHPRSRGEHGVVIPAATIAAGSSPLTRGALVSGSPLDGPLGIIPAHAGSTVGRRSSLCRPWDHPRSRGEHDLYAVNVHDPRGSSPLTRGAREYYRECLPG